MSSGLGQGSKVFLCGDHIHPISWNSPAPQAELQSPLSCSSGKQAQDPCCFKYLLLILFRSTCKLYPNSAWLWSGPPQIRTSFSSPQVGSPKAHSSRVPAGRSPLCHTRLHIPPSAAFISKISQHTQKLSVHRSTKKSPVPFTCTCSTQCAFEALKVPSQTLIKVIAFPW